MEAVILDPAAVATDRVELDITRWIAEAGPDWGDAQIEQYLAEAQRGQLPVDYRIPNRVITIPLLLLDQAPATFAEMRRAVQAKAALFQSEGGWLTREIDGTPWYADVVKATLKLGGSTAQAMLGIDADAVLTLETLPDFYGDEVTLTPHSTAAGDAELVFTEAVVDGDYPARCRIIVGEVDSIARFGLLWGIRSRHYSAAPTARLAYEAEALTPLDSAALATVAGASGGASNNVVRHAAVSAAAWTPVLSTRHATAGPLTHTGSYRVWVRAHTTAAAPPRLQLVWDTGDINAPAENAAVYVPAANAFYDLDLGEVRLDAAPVGTHRWAGQIQARGDVGGENISIDKVWLVPVDEGYGVLRMSPSSLAGAISARDGFTGTTVGGALNARTPTVGAAWATSGATTDFTFLDAQGYYANLPPSEAVGRSVSAASLRFGVLGSVMTDQQISAQVGAFPDNLGKATGECGAIARWVDANNYLRFTTVFQGVKSGGGPTVSTIRVTKVVAGSPEVILSRPLNAYYGYFVTLSLAVSANGNVTARLYSSNGGLVAELAATDTDLATGGTLDDGKGGIVDSGDGTNTVPRWYDDVVVSAPPPEPVVINAGRSSELRWDRNYRQTSDGTGYDNINYVTGDLPRLPPSGLEGRPVEVFLKASRGDFDQRADTGIDDITAQVRYRPSYLFAPDEPVGS